MLMTRVMPAEIKPQSAPSSIVTPKMSGAKIVGKRKTDTRVPNIPNGDRPNLALTLCLLPILDEVADPVSCFPAWILHVLNSSK